MYIFDTRIDVFYGNKHSLVVLQISIGGFKGLVRIGFESL